MEFEAVLEQLERDVLANTMHVNHPRFLAYVPGPGNFVGAMADALISGYNVFAGTWISGSGPAAVELTVLEWLREMCGLPEGAGGCFVSGGTHGQPDGPGRGAPGESSPDRLEDATVYFSDQAHSSLEKALRVIGLPAAKRSQAAVGRRLTGCRSANWRDAIEKDRAAGKRPFCVIASAGTTNTGAIDPLPANFPNSAGSRTSGCMWTALTGRRP